MKKTKYNGDSDMSGNRELEIAEFQGRVLEKLENIERFVVASTLDRQGLHKEVDELKTFQSRQKVYLSVAIMVGGVLIWVVDRLIAYWQYFKAK